MPGKVAIIFANLKGNIGDFAILHSMIVDIQNHRPDTEVDVYSQPFVTVDERRLKAFQDTAPRFSYKGTGFEDNRQLSPSIAETLNRFHLLRIFQALRVSTLAHRAGRHFGKKFSDYDAIYVAGGAQWVGLNTGVSMFANLLGIAEANPRIFTYPVSVSSVVWKYHKRSDLSKYLTHIQKPLIARDSQTFNEFAKLGLDAVVGADCVFALANSANTSDGLQKSGSNRVLFVLTNQDASKIEPAIKITREAGFEPAFLTTCAIEDALVQKTIADTFGIDFIAPLTWQDAVVEMRSSALVITNRLHGLILASFAPACVLPLINRSKVKAVVNDADLPIYLERLQNLDFQKLSAVRHRSEEIKGKLSSYRDRAQELAWSPFLAASS